MSLVSWSCTASSAGDITRENRRAPAGAATRRGRTGGHGRNWSPRTCERPLLTPFPRIRFLTCRRKIIRVGELDSTANAARRPRVMSQRAILTKQHPLLPALALWCCYRWRCCWTWFLSHGLVNDEMLAMRFAEGSDLGEAIIQSEKRCGVRTGHVRDVVVLMFTDSSQLWAGENLSFPNLQAKPASFRVGTVAICWMAAIR